ncbi:OLC1v1037680C1 [Oldenlandia corymbosa var. corymbosa]|uniref:OLC1v1037680C1 n=1 Tax=Oldenlandia corymbosa var. corymbosa TaxID=529605 RepID=A0AAV1D0M2_OLDCO|nr:OLC1v1037680C1 [Oldenlandia corymbosa var. corymbosa]
MRGVLWSDIGEIKDKISSLAHVAGGGNEGIHRLLRSAEVYDPKKKRWSFISDMSTDMVPLIGVVYEGNWFLKVVGAHRKVLSEFYKPETDSWRPVFDGLVDGWRNLYSLECKDGCKLKVYDEATDSWSKHIDSRMHRGSSKAFKHVLLVSLRLIPFLL